MTSSLKHGLVLWVSIGSLIFAALAGAALFAFEFQSQRSEAKEQQKQLAATVKSSAAVAAFVANEEIARDVVKGLLSNSLVAAAAIENEAGKVIYSNHKVTGAELRREAATRYPLPSPISVDDISGLLLIEQDDAYIDARAMQIAFWQSVILVVQIAISGILLILLFDHTVGRPLGALARMVAQAIPGSGTRLVAPPGQTDTEIGLLVLCTNALLGTAESAIDEERELRAKVEKMEAYYRRIFETTNVGIMVLNEHGNLINSNPVLLSRIVGIHFDGGHVKESNKFIETIFCEPDVVWSLINEAAKTHRSVSADCQLRTANDSEKWAHCIISVVLGRKGQIELIEGVLYDVTDRRIEEDKMRRQADHDALTGLRNRRGMESFLDRSLRHAAENEQCVGVLLIDLDGFKAVNDTQGHDAGDQVLKGVAERLLGRIRRSSDAVARQGGDEFVIIANNCGNDTKAVEEIATDVVSLMREPFQLDDGSFAQIGASIGIARYPLNGHTRTTVIAAADAAMYVAKKSGKNRHSIAPTDDHPPDSDLV